MVRALITHCLSLFLGLRRLEGPLHRTMMSVLNTVTYMSKVKVIWKLAAVVTSWYPHTCLMYERSAVSPRCLWFNNYTVWWVVVVALRLLAQGLPSALWIKAYLKLSKRCVSSVRLSCATKVVGRQSDDHTPSMAQHEQKVDTFISRHEVQKAHSLLISQRLNYPTHTHITNAKPISPCLW